MEYYLNKPMEASSSQFSVDFKESFSDDEVMFFIHGLTSRYDTVPVPLSYTGKNITGRFSSPPAEKFQIFTTMIGRWK